MKDDLPTYVERDLKFVFEGHPDIKAIAEYARESIAAYLRAAPAVRANVGAENVVVPREPTQAIREAMFPWIGADWQAGDCYRAIIQAAAPVGADVRADEHVRENKPYTSRV